MIDPSSDRHGTAEIEISACRFLRHVSRVEPGTKVVFRGFDAPEHQIEGTLDGKPTYKVTTNGRYQSVSVTLDEPGIVHFFDPHFPWMSAYVIVAYTSHTWTRLTSPGGAFHLDRSDLYEAHTLYLEREPFDGQPEHLKHVDVPAASGNVIDLHVTFP